MRPVWSCVALALTFCSACRAPRDPEPPVMPTRVMPTQDPTFEEPERAATPARWRIDGGSVAENPNLPFELVRALEGRGYVAEDAQDYVLGDFNDDGRRDAVVLMVSNEGFEGLALLSEGEDYQVKSVSSFLEDPPHAIVVVPLLAGPTLIGLAPRPGECTRGPSWSFVRVTGVVLDPVGSLSIDPYDCAEAEAEIQFVRDARGHVSAVELRHGSELQRYTWDPAHGAFTRANALRVVE